MGWAVLLAAFFLGSLGFIAAAAVIVLLGTVFAAVYHAEVVAHRVGEPFGTLVLALAVTVIETALIVSVMIAAPAEKAGLARDTVFAAVMIVCNGIVGACLLWGGAHHREQGFQIQGASAALAVLAALTCLTLVLPNFVALELGPRYSTAQLVFAGLVSLVLYGSFVFVQTVRHRDYFLPVQTDDPEAHAPPPTATVAALSAALLVVSLVAVVGLAKILTPAVEAGIAYVKVPKAVVGIVIAALVLLPEGLAAIRTARNNRLQTSLNLALGLRARDHRPDDPGGGRCVDRDRAAARSRPRRERSTAAGADAAAQRDHPRHRPDHGAAGHRASGDLRGVFVLRRGAVTRAQDATAKSST